MTDTAALHAASWKELFDTYLSWRAEQRGEGFRPFDIHSDYQRYVDGNPRYDGVRSFLESRSIALPYGSPEDPPERETVCGLGNRKNLVFRARLATDGVAVFDSSVALIRDPRARGVPMALVSSSRNALPVCRSGAGRRDRSDGGGAPQLLEVGESGEFKRGTLGESKESYKVETYGGVVAIIRQTLINDDLDAFRIPAMCGNSIAQLESDVVWCAGRLRDADRGAGGQFRPGAAHSGCATSPWYGRVRQGRQSAFMRRKTFEVEADALLPEVEGIVDPGWFLAKKVIPADTPSISEISSGAESPSASPLLLVA